MVTQTIPLDEQTAKDLDDLAQKTGKKPEDIAAQAVREHVEYTRYVIKEIEAGLKDADEGRVMTADELRQRLAERRRAREPRGLLGAARGGAT